MNLQTLKNKKNAIKKTEERMKPCKKRSNNNKAERASKIKREKNGLKNCFDLQFESIFNVRHTRKHLKVEPFCTEMPFHFICYKRIMFSKFLVITVVADGSDKPTQKVAETLFFFFADFFHSFFQRTILLQLLWRWLVAL